MEIFIFSLAVLLSEIVPPTGFRFVLEPFLPHLRVRLVLVFVPDRFAAGRQEEIMNQSNTPG